MAGAELFGKEKFKEVMDVMETGILMKYGFDKERKGVFKVSSSSRNMQNIWAPDMRSASPRDRRR